MVVLGLRNQGVGATRYVTVALFHTDLSVNSRYKDSLSSWWMAPRHASGLVAFGEITLINDQVFSKTWLISLCKWPTHNCLLVAVTDVTWSCYQSFNLVCSLYRFVVVVLLLLFIRALLKCYCCAFVLGIRVHSCPPLLYFPTPDRTCTRCGHL